MDFNNPEAGTHIRFPALCLLYFICKFQPGKSIPEDVQNVALNKPSWMFSRDPVNGIASRANDGDTKALKDFCAQSAFGSQLDFDWWRVDLIHQHQIWYADVTTVADCCSFSMANFEIRVAEKLDDLDAANQKSQTEKVCVKQIPGLAPGVTKRLPCDNAPVYGRYVTLIMPSNQSLFKKNNRLVLCELAIYAQENKSEVIIGADCPKTKCPDGLKCGTRNGKNGCYVELEGSCRGHTEDCAENLTCDASYYRCGYDVGTPCSETHPRCRSGTRCERTTCEYQVGWSCSDEFHCAKPGFCEKGKCVCPEAYKLGPRCWIQNPTVPCSDYKNWCKFGSTCDATGSCRRSTESFCRGDEECVPGALCKGLIKGKQGGKCTCQEAFQNQNSTDGTCAPTDGLVFGSCSSTPCKDSNAECKSGVCLCKTGYNFNKVNYTCASPSGACSDNKDCGTGFTCDLNECRIPVGKGCRGELRSYCKLGTICDTDHICRINVYGECFANAGVQTCRVGTFCDLGWICRFPVGAWCSKSTEFACSAGSICVGGTCQCNPEVAKPAREGGRVCVPLEEKGNRICTNNKTCTLSMGGNASCQTRNTAIVCLCNPGYINVNYRCRPTAGSSCSGDKGCARCHTCEDSICKSKAGCKCTEDDACVTGAVCDADNTCKLSLGSFCGTPDREMYCIRGAICDTFKKTCKLQAGKGCTTHPDQCPARSSCTDGQCKCDQGTLQGSICVTEEGEVGGPCHTVKCKDERATCDDDGLCHLDIIEDGGGNGLVIGLVIASVLVLILGGLVLWLLYKRRKEKQKAATDMDKNQDNAQPSLSASQQPSPASSTQQSTGISNSTEANKVSQKDSEAQPTTAPDSSSATD